MPSVHDLKESRFITQHDVEPPVLVTIKSFEEINVAKPGAEEEFRWCVWFREFDKPMTLNSTNGQILASIIGSEELNDGIGQNIVLYRDPNISFGNKLVGGIRIRAPKKGFKAPELPPQSEQETPPDDSDIPF
jgi:hypothetical protein